jgi:hypothetical protein
LPNLKYKKNIFVVIFTGCSKTEKGKTACLKTENRKCRKIR